MNLLNQILFYFSCIETISHVLLIGFFFFVIFKKTKCTFNRVLQLYIAAGFVTNCNNILSESFTEVPTKLPVSLPSENLNRVSSLFT